MSQIDLRKRLSEDTAMSVQFDTSLGVWLVVRSDGTIVTSGFATHSSACRWIDEREDDQVDLRYHRVRNAIRSR